MCGLVGLISKNSFGFTRDQQEVFASLLFVDLLRGSDSTGAFVVDNTGNVVVAKEVGHSLDFIRTDAYDTLNKRAFQNGAAMIGHNRKATRGDVTDVNAHPFNVDNNIILVHNGTMFGDHKKHANVDVDSHAIAHLIHEKGTVGEALSSFYGAYALIWYDVKEGSINFVRNDQRPLWWMETRNSWVWASTPDMLEFVRIRHNLDIVVRPTELKELSHVKFTQVDRGKWETSTTPVEIKRDYSQVGSYDSGTVWNYPQRGQSFRGEQDAMYEAEDGAFENWVDKHWPGQVHRAPRPNSLQQQPKRDAVVQLLPSPTPANTGPKRPVEDTKEPPEFAGIETRERAVAKASNNLIPYGEWQKRILGRAQYPWGHGVHVIPFDYVYVNGRDSTDGFYLYAVPVDGDSVMLRQYFSSHQTTEERIIQIATGGYVYEFMCGQKGWTSMAGLTSVGHNHRDDEPGYIVIRSLQCRMLTNPMGHKIIH